MSKAEIEEFCPSNQQEWRDWLETNHQSKKSVWLILHKKNSPTPNLTWSESVDEALCFGWIDSVKKTIDEHRYKQFYCPRKKDSIWSKINKAKTEELIAKGLMKDAGLKTIEVAKSNGSWSILDDVDALIVPPDLEDLFQKFDGAKSYYENLSNSIKKQLLYWVISAKRPETRLKRITEIAECMHRNELPKQFK